MIKFNENEMENDYEWPKDDPVRKKEKIEPYCKWCKDEMCVYAECPACGDYCPVPNLPGVCRFEKREDMTPKKAWGNIADRLKIYAEEHGFTDEDVAAEVMAYRALCDAKEVVNE